MADERAVADVLGDIGPATRWAAEVMAAAQVPPALVNAVEVCIEEALANLVMHGVAGADGAKAIRLAVDPAPACVTVTVRDSCIPFDLTRAPDLGAPDHHDMRVGGQGIRLLRGLTTELDYGQDDAGNRLTLTFRAD